MHVKGPKQSKNVEKYPFPDTPIALFSDVKVSNERPDINVRALIQFFHPLSYVNLPVLESNHLHISELTKDFNHKVRGID